LLNTSSLFIHLPAFLPTHLAPLFASSDQAEMRAREDALTAALADELAAGDAERKEV
jgi:hypothetical protein